MAPDRIAQAEHSASKLASPLTHPLVHHPFPGRVLVIFVLFVSGRLSISPQCCTLFCTASPRGGPLGCWATPGGFVSEPYPIIARAGELCDISLLELDG
jgi:hypothetical protein